MLFHFHCSVPLRLGLFFRFRMRLFVALNVKPFRAVYSPK